MKEIRRELHKMDGFEFECFSTDAVHLNILEAAAGAGEDPENNDKWACKTYLRLKDQGGTNMQVNLLKDGLGRVDGIELELRGYAELETMIESLEFMKQALIDAREEMRNGTN